MACNYEEKYLEQVKVNVEQVKSFDVLYKAYQLLCDEKPIKAYREIKKYLDELSVETREKMLKRQTN